MLGHGCSFGAESSSGGCGANVVPTSVVACERPTLTTTASRTTARTPVARTSSGSPVERVLRFAIALLRLGCLTRTGRRLAPVVQSAREGAHRENAAPVMLLEVAAVHPWRVRRAPRQPPRRVKTGEEARRPG